MEKKKYKRIAVYVPGKDYDILKAILTLKGSTASALMRKFMREYLQANKGLINLEEDNGKEKAKSNQRMVTR